MEKRSSSLSAGCFFYFNAASIRSLGTQPLFTGGFALPCKHVIHVTGPAIPQGLAFFFQLPLLLPIHHFIQARPLTRSSRRRWGHVTNYVSKLQLNTGKLFIALLPLKSLDKHFLHLFFNLHRFCLLLYLSYFTTDFFVYFKVEFINLFISVYLYIDLASLINVSLFSIC